MYFSAETVPEASCEATAVVVVKEVIGTIRPSPVGPRRKHSLLISWMFVGTYFFASTSITFGLHQQSTERRWGISLPSASFLPQSLCLMFAMSAPKYSGYQRSENEADCADEDVAHVTFAPFQLCGKRWPQLAFEVSHALPPCECSG